MVTGVFLFVLNIDCSGNIFKVTVRPIHLLKACCLFLAIFSFNVILLDIRYFSNKFMVH